MKTYEEALQRAKAYYDSTDSILDKELLELVFSELKETDDERIRKALWKRIINYDPNNEILIKEEGISQKQFLAWLEKQKSIDVLDDEEREFADNVDSYRKEVDAAYQKGYNEGVRATLEKQGKTHNENSEPKFKVGDWITDGNITIQIEAIKNNCYLYCGDCILYSTKTADKVYHLWTIADAKPGDVIVSEQLTILFKKFEEYTDYNFVIAYAGIDVSGKIQITNEHWLISDETKPATKEQRDTLFAKMKEAGYEWDADKKELKKIEDEEFNGEDYGIDGLYHAQRILEKNTW